MKDIVGHPFEMDLGRSNSKKTNAVKEGFAFSDDKLDASNRTINDPMRLYIKECVDGMIDLRGGISRINATEQLIMQLEKYLAGMTSSPTAKKKVQTYSGPKGKKFTVPD